MKNFDKPNDVHWKMETTFWKLFLEYDVHKLFPTELIKVSYNQLSEDDETQPNEYSLDIFLEKTRVSEISTKSFYKFSNGLYLYLKYYPNIRYKELSNECGFLTIVGYLEVEEEVK